MQIEEVVAFAACALRGGTASPCPYGWHSVRYRPLRPLRYRPLRYGLGVGGHGVPCPYGWRSVRYRPLRLCVFALPSFALRSWRGGARHRRAPTGGVLCVTVLCAFASLRYRPLRYGLGVGGHGIAVPLRVAFCALPSFAPLR
ncbi:hypothetical protein Cagg_1937 [Chloroflexus aggregans DSM 9485]|uniref:Uncharacterized protein n=1 Tax=Chloroflexus aggregans (strain MD-66 / DSM 9485) TaxID=326427 RepID=B8GBK4_CHLAD|nr:hypothetical protein Cagg_1937 [Chloroflexus aggregans DSM 9485]